MNYLEIREALKSIGCGSFFFDDNHQDHAHRCVLAEETLCEECRAKWNELLGKITLAELSTFEAETRLRHREQARQIEAIGPVMVPARMDDEWLCPACGVDLFADYCLGSYWQKHAPIFELGVSDQRKAEIFEFVGREHVASQNSSYRFSTEHRNWLEKQKV